MIRLAFLRVVVDAKEPPNLQIRLFASSADNNKSERERSPFERLNKHSRVRHDYVLACFYGSATSRTRAGCTHAACTSKELFFVSFLSLLVPSPTHYRTLGGSSFLGSFAIYCTYLEHILLRLADKLITPVTVQVKNSTGWTRKKMDNCNSDFFLIVNLVDSVEKKSVESQFVELSFSKMHLLKLGDQHIS